MTHAVLLSIHIAAGAVGLLLGPVAMWQATRRLGTAQNPNAGASAAYHWLVLAVCLSAAVLVVWFRPELWWLVPVAAFSYALVLVGRIAVDRRFRGWTHAYVHGQGGSYIALVTALVVVALTVDGPLHGAAELIPWVLPIAIGLPLIEWWRRLLIQAIAQRGTAVSGRTG
jgi:hypothetical protein